MKKKGAEDGLSERRFDKSNYRRHKVL